MPKPCALSPKESLPHARKFARDSTAACKERWLHCDADSGFSTEAGSRQTIYDAPGPHLGGPEPLLDVQ
jgi:hypothetical protein